MGFFGDSKILKTIGSLPMQIHLRYFQLTKKIPLNSTFYSESLPHEY